MEQIPIFSKGCRNPNEFLIKKNIPKDTPTKNYIFVKNVNGEWTESNGKSKKFDKLVIRKKYIDENEEIQNEIKGENIKDENGIEKAPAILILEDHEKFQDEQGNIFEIETRGSKQHDKIYFKVKDVEKAFEMKSLQKIILDSDTKYKNQIDYIFFICENGKIVSEKTNKKTTIKKELFLTYKGMLHVLFASHSGKANSFVKWASELLFTVQMGTNEQKNKLIAKVLGTSVENVIEVFNTHTNKLPVLYFFTLGYVKDLRLSMNINANYKDNMIVAIYGRTDDIVRRTKEHNVYYKKVKGVNLRLKYESFVDPQFLSNAENEISEYVDDLKCRFLYEKENEMIIIDEKQLKRFESQYESVSKKYMGHITELVNQLKEEQNKNKILQLTYEKDTNDLQHKLIEEQQKSEIWSLKYQLLEEKGIKKNKC
jgi:hypothetical protein